MSDVSPNVLANLLFNGGLFAVLLWFLMFRVWPWFTSVYLPGRWQREDAIMRTVSDNLTELRHAQAHSESKIGTLTEAFYAHIAEQARANDTMLMLMSIEVGERAKVLAKRNTGTTPTVKP